MKKLLQKIIHISYIGILLIPLVFPLFTEAEILNVYTPSSRNVTSDSATFAGSIRYKIENRDLDTYFAYEEVSTGYKSCSSLLLTTTPVRYYPPSFQSGTIYVSPTETVNGLKPNTRYIFCSIAKETYKDNFNFLKTDIKYSGVSVFTTTNGGSNNSGLTTISTGQIGDTYAVLAGSIILPQPNPPRFKTSFFLFRHENGKSYSCNTIATLTLSGRNPIYGSKGVSVELFDVYGDGNFTRIARFLEPGTTYDYCAYSQEANAKITTKRISGGIIVTTITPAQKLANNVLSFTTTGGTSGGNTGGGRKSPRDGSTVRPDLIGNVTTLPIQHTTDTEAMLVGNVDRAGDPAYGYFRFSTAKKPPIFCNDIYGSNMRSITATNTTKGQYNNDKKSGKISTGNFYGLATNLQPNTEYYYCAVVSNNATNPTEIEYGKVLKFKTRPCPTCDQTDVVTDVATNIGYDTARLHGSYFSIEDMKTYFEYKENEKITVLLPIGQSSKNNWIETGEKVSHKANSYGKISATINGLKAETSYSFRAVGKTSNPEQIYYGDILNFQTHSDPNGHGYEIEDPDGVEDYDGDGEPDGEDDDDGIDDDGDGYDDDGDEEGDGEDEDDEEGDDDGDIDDDGEEDDTDDNDENDEDGDNEDQDDDNDEDIDDDGIDDENDDNDGADNDGDGSDADDNDSDNDGESDETDDNDGLDTDGDGSDSDNNDIDNDGEDNANDDNDGLDTDGDGSDADTNDHDNDGEPDGVDDNDGIDSDGDGKDADDDDKDNDGEKNSDDYNDGIDSDGDGKDADDSDSDNDGEKDSIDDNDGIDSDGDGFDNDGKYKENIYGNKKGGTKKIGQIGNPEPDAIVRYHEGIEHVIYRQIKSNNSLIENYKEVDNDGTENYYWNMAHQMAIDFAYVDRNTGREIRVSQPDVSAYELEQIGNRLYVYEYHFDGKVWRIIDVRETTTIFKNKNPFEYYFSKIRKFFGF